MALVDELVAQGFVIQADNAGSTVGVGTLVAGAATVATTAVGPSSRILLTVQTNSGQATPQALAAPVASIVAGVSFVVASASGTDTSTFVWQIV